MTGDLLVWIVGALMAVFGLGGLYVKGRKDGKKVEKAKQDEVNKQAEQKHVQTIDKAKHVEIDVAKLPAGAAEQRLRDKYSRD